MPLGSLVAGLLLQAFSAVWSLAVLAAITVAVALAVSLSAAVRNAPRADELARIRE
jgi:hypothetical protein